MELLPKLENDQSEEENETDKNDDDDDDEDIMDEELNDVGDLMSNNPVSMNQRAPLSSISETSLDRMDNGDMQRK